MNLFGNQKVISAGLSDYKLHINKDRTELSINVGGINVRTHFSFFKIYQFMETNTLIMKTYAENLKVQLSSQEYLNFIDPKKRGRTLAQGKELPPDEERKIQPGSFNSGSQQSHDIKYGTGQGTNNSNQLLIGQQNPFYHQPNASTDARRNVNLDNVGINLNQRHNIN